MLLQGMLSVRLSTGLSSLLCPHVGLAVSSSERVVVRRRSRLAPNGIQQPPTHPLAVAYC